MIDLTKPLIANSEAFHNIPARLVLETLHSIVVEVTNSGPVLFVFNRDGNPLEDKVHWIISNDKKISPYNFITFPGAAMKVRNKTTNAHVVACVQPTRVMVYTDTGIGGSISFDQLLANYVQLDGKPCGVEQ